MISNKILKQKKVLIALGIVVTFFLILLTLLLVSKKLKQPKNINTKSSIIQTSKESLTGDSIWQEHLEENIAQEAQNRKQDTIGLTNKIMETKSKLNEENLYRYQVLKQELEGLKDEIISLKSKKENIKTVDKAEEKSQIAVYPVEQDNELISKDISWYLPQTSYVKGRLLNGISVSTGANAPSDPQPVVIRLTDMASLPRFFEFDVCDCRILAESYGNLSSERAILRLTSLACIEKKTKKAVETNIAGYVVGPDGVSGIKGEVVSIDSKHLKFAFLGGILSGAGATLQNDKSGELQILTPGAGSKSLKEKFSSGFGEGLSSTNKALQDYYIRRAESIQPVIQIGAGTAVDIVFTQGVFLGSKNVQKVIAKDRKRNNDKNN